MRKNKRTAFTLIELIAVLVIMAILALIVTPIVMNIIRKVRVAADKRSIDAYGRSIELAVAGYLLDNGYFPTSVDQLTIEYSGNEVECSTIQLNDDSSVYLTGCTVAGRTVDYAYGADKTPQSPTYAEYSLGDEVNYNNVDYYVIANSGTSEPTVTLLKAEPLSAQEISDYAPAEAQTDGRDMNFHSSSNSYSVSFIKVTVDGWKAAKALTAIDARLITFDDLTTNLGYEYIEEGTWSGYKKTESTPSWLYNSNYWYWTMTPSNDSTFYMMNISYSGSIESNANVSYGYGGQLGAVRPVIVLPKSALPTN